MTLDINGMIDFLADWLPTQHPPLAEVKLLQALASAFPEYASYWQQPGDLALFQRHFLLYHCLYRLRQQWQGKGICLDIGLAKVSWSPSAMSQDVNNHSHQPIGPFDKLEQYYLDLTQLGEMDERQLQQMLDTFWQQFAKLPNMHLNEARHFLQLPETFTLSQLKKQYRKLAFEYHPDQGGAKPDFIRLQHAFKYLKQYLAS